MSPSKFDRFMVDVRNGSNFKLARLSHAHYRALFSAVLPIAALSKVRGAFMVNGEPATVDDMRLVSPKLTPAECKSALTAFRAIGLLEHDDELGGEWVHDFGDWNPDPKNDVTNAERQRRYQAKLKASQDAVSNGVTNGVGTPVTNALAREEVEEEEKGKGNKAATPLRSRADTVSRSLAETVQCPRCGVAPGVKCDGVRAKRESCHLERHHAAGELLDLPKVSPSSARRSKPDASRPAFSPDPEAVTLRNEHFPDQPIEAVQNCATTLRFRRQEVTPEAVRSLLYGDEGTEGRAA